MPQFRNKSHQEVRQYILEKKGVDIAGNSGIVKAFLIFCVAMIAILGGLWLYNQYKNRNDNGTENRY